MDNNKKITHKDNNSLINQTSNLININSLTQKHQANHKRRNQDLTGKSVAKIPQTLEMRVCFSNDLCFILQTARLTLKTQSHILEPAVTLYAGISPRHVNSYHQDNNLLFQFILMEFLEAYAEMQKLDSLCCHSPSPLPKDELACRQTENNLHLIQDVLVKLIGATRDYMRLFSWNFNEGMLAKLRTYCVLFLQNADTDEKELLALQHYADKIWHHCFQAVDALNEIPPDRQFVFSALEKSSAAMQRFSRQIIRHLHQFKNNENVIFFVLRNHKRFDQLYGNRFVIRLFLKMYPKGIKDVLSFLIKKYSSRGFENMLPEIVAAASEVEAASL